MVDSIYVKNEEALKKRFPQYSSFVEYMDTESPVGVAEAEGKKILYVEHQGDIIQMDTLYGTDELMELWYQKIPGVGLFAKIIFFGFGNGAYVRKLLNHLDRSNHVIVYEPNFMIFHKVMQEYDISDIILDDRFDLLVRETMTKAPADYFSDRLSFLDIDTFQYYVYLNYNILFPEFFSEYLHALESACNGINSTQSVMDRYGSAYYENTFSNMHFLLKSKSLENLYLRLPHNVPAIVVAAGPSLDKNIKDLAAAKEKAFIIAVDTALRPLLKAGIMPDLCISIDPKKRVEHFSDDRANDIPMVCYLVSHKEIMDRHRAEKIFINDLNHHIQHFFSQKCKIFPVVSSGGSVANDAFSIAQMLGFQTIILVGQDLAYTDQKTHSEASVRGEWKIDVSKLKKVMMEGIDGKPIASSGEFVLYKAWFEEQIINYPNITVIDATEGGAKIYGSRIMALKDAISENCMKSYDFKEIIRDTDAYLSDSEQKEFVEYVKKIPEELESCLRLVKEGIALYNKMLTLIYKDKYHGTEFKNSVHRTGEIGAKIEKMPVMEYVKCRIQKQTSNFLKNIYETYADERSELIDSCNKGIEYLEIIKCGIIELLPDIKSKIEKMPVSVINRI
ncbi:MAG: DUF115 domain-containing protein [Lachnospiraceae bacterium]